jgi:hypothetical protein
MPKKSTEDDFNWGRMPHPWFKQAYDIAKRNESFTAVKVKSEEFDQWFKWFRNELGFVPQFMLHGKMRANLSKKDDQDDYAVTLPDRWPPKRQIGK